jgi:hypothetical protein
MKLKILILAVIFYLILSNSLFADPGIKISGIQIPLPERSIQKDSRLTPQARIVTYAVNKPLDEVVRFYESYLKENGFIVIGGAQEAGFNASVKKDSIMFTIRIYPQDGKTLIQFIW